MMRALRLSLAFLAAGLSLAAGGCAALLGPQTYHAYLLLTDVAAGAGPSALKRAAGAPSRDTIAWEARGISGIADLYLPEHGATGKLLLVPGLAPEGKDHPLLVAFAESFARSGFAVMVPDIASLRALRASPDNVAEIAAAARFFSLARPQGLTERHVAVAALSYAVGPALLAAAGAPADDAIGLVIAIGGYADTIETITFVTTGATRGPDGAWRAGVPNTYGRWAFVLANAQRLSRAEDRDALTAIADRKLADPSAPFDDLARTLSAEGHAVLALVTNSDPDAVPALVAALPASISGDIAALDLARADLSRVRADVVLIHGADDTIIPATQSAKLAGLLPPGQAHLALVSHLMHVEFQRGLTLTDALTLLCAGQRIIAFRDR